MSVTLGTDNYLYNGFLSHGIRKEDPKPRVDPHKISIIGNRRTQLYYRNKKPTQVTYSCAKELDSGAEECLIFSRLFGRMPLGQVPNEDKEFVRETEKLISETLEGMNPQGWKTDGTDGRTFVFSKKLPAMFANQFLEWHIKVDPKPHLAKQIIRTVPKNDPNPDEIIVTDKFEWGERDGHWIPVRIKTDFHQRPDDSEMVVEKELKLTSFKIVPPLDDSYYAIDVPQGIKIVDHCPDDRVQERLGGVWLVGIIFVLVCIVGLISHQVMRRRFKTG